MANLLVRGISKALRILRSRILPRRIFLIDNRDDLATPPTSERAEFFLGHLQVPIKRVSASSTAMYWQQGPVLVRGLAPSAIPLAVRLGTHVLDVDENRSPLEAWNWHDALNMLDTPVDLKGSRATYARWKSNLPPANRAYVFGTGPSLARAMDRDWSDGYRIVCNTIVRDPALWHHISPHAIVAGDGLYHFGITPFARQFREDLKARLKESPSVIFIYPAKFDAFVRRELRDYTDQLVPIPIGKSITVHSSIQHDFTLPNLGNILNLLLLPVACDLSKKVGLWGFDGRAPSDKLFWANSNAHTYADLMDSLRAASPAFFDAMVPKHDPESYVRAVHGDVLAACLARAESAGYTFEMLHQSWTPTLAKYFDQTKGGA